MPAIPSRAEMTTAGVLLAAAVGVVAAIKGPSSSSPPVKLHKSGGTVSEVTDQEHSAWAGPEARRWPNLAEIFEHGNRPRPVWTTHGSSGCTDIPESATSADQHVGTDQEGTS